MYLKCDTADCKGTAKIDQGLLVRTIYGTIHANSKTADLLPKAITCRFNYLQIHTIRCSGDCWKFSVLISCRFHIIFRSELLSTPSEFGRLMKAAMF